ncbi:MAG TPA: hypothetical protein VL126_05965, partial [Bacteroidota bacterium]|nr:hypothetical protein [Bacteroidota bacterium]
LPTGCSTCNATSPRRATSMSTHTGVTPRFPQDSRHTSAACTKCHQTPTNYTQYCCQSSGCHNNYAGGGD